MRSLRTTASSYHVGCAGGAARRALTARCHDRDHALNAKAKFTYSDGQSDTVKSKSTCEVKH
jgi:hypothetical protein